MSADGKRVYVIEKRLPDGALDFSRPQPEDIFTMKAVTGITEDEMAKVIFKRAPGADLRGSNIPLWPSFINQKFTAREKTWG